MCVTAGPPSAYTKPLFCYFFASAPFHKRICQPTEWTCTMSNRGFSPLLPTLLFPTGFIFRFFFCVHNKRFRPNRISTGDYTLTRTHMNINGKVCAVRNMTAGDSDVLPMLTRFAAVANDRRSHPSHHATWPTDAIYFLFDSSPHVVFSFSILSLFSACGVYKQKVISSQGSPLIWTR